MASPVRGAFFSSPEQGVIQRHASPFEQGRKPDLGYLGRSSSTSNGVSRRSVSHLTFEQLERKRAYDRSNQQSIRDRRKKHVEHLEGQIRTLAAQLDEKVPRLLQRNKILEQHNNWLQLQLWRGASSQFCLFRLD